MESSIYHKADNDFSINYYETNLENNQPLEHFHDMFEIDFFADADIKIFVKNRQYDIKDGDVLFINKFEIHRMVYSSNTHYARYVIGFKDSYLQGLLKELHLEGLLKRMEGYADWKVSTNLKQKNLMESMVKSIYAAWKNPLSPNRAAEKEALIKLYLVQFIIHLEESLKRSNFETAKARKANDHIQAIISCLDTRYMTKITLEDLSDELFLNKFYISHIFKETTGFSFVEYLQHRRIIEAQKMLTQTSKNILEICYDCGFNNIQHFCRVFKAITGTTPSKYKEKAK